MKKENIFMIVIPVLLVILAVLGYLALNNTVSDSIRFKNEYEKLNEKYLNVSIDEDNNIVYSSYKKIFNVLKKETGIIYLGTPEDDNSRYAIDYLLKMLKEKNIKDKVYYLDISNDRDFYTVKDNKLVYEVDEKGNELKGTENYFKLIEYLDNYLGEYVIYYDDIEYNPNVKRIPIPSIIFVQNGELVGFEYISTDVDSESLYEIYEDNLSILYSTTCDTNTKEPC